MRVLAVPRQLPGQPGQRSDGRDGGGLMPAAVLHLTDEERAELARRVSERNKESEQRPR
ncbi:hypothetical protein GCM10010360_21890 [Streptomyces nogalater]